MLRTLLLLHFFIPNAPAQSSFRLSDTAAITATAFDRDGNLYLAGTVSDNQLPSTAGVFQPSLKVLFCTPCVDAFVAKISADGRRLLFATYLGGSGQESVTSLAVDPEGNPVVAGTTNSQDFPVSPGAHRTRPASAFVTRLTADGTRLLGSTYLDGGTLRGLAVDTQGAVYFVASSTGVSKLDPPLRSVVYNHPVKGAPAALAVDDQGSVYITGTTASSSGDSDVFVTKLDPSGAAELYSKVFGGSGDDEPKAIVVDAAYQAYVVGVGLEGYPFTSGKRGLGFAASVAADGSRLRYATRIAATTRQAIFGPSRTLLITGALAGPLETVPDSDDPCPMQGDFFTALDLDTGAVRYTSLRDKALAIDSSGNALTQPAHSSAWFAKTGFLTDLPPQIRCIVNAADLREHGIAPGEVLAIFGPDIGPPEPAVYMLDENNTVPRELAGVRVLFDDIPAPVLYVSGNQINVVSPFGISGRTGTVIRVQREGREITATR
ncbi:MAG: SBBP repeat-containing protein, partial [Bryobacterales bacterium]|nr:SBBP repeat-containing protein [Bryobacterales bacterium]